jgi:glycerol kinase
MLMNIDTLDWNEVHRRRHGHPDVDAPRDQAPPRRCTARARRKGFLPGVPIAGILGRPAGGHLRPGVLRARHGEEHLRHRLLHADEHREEPVPQRERPAHHGLLQDRRQPPVYALEGSIAVDRVAGAVAARQPRVHLRRREIEEAATKVEDNGGAYFVPAFSGLFAPYWRSDARGALVGPDPLRQQEPPRRAVLESVAYQTREVLEAMNADAGHELTELKVDGGMVVNEVLMQFQADQLGVDVVRPKVAETTALGAAYAAGIAVGFWSGEQDVIDNWAEDKRWTPQADQDERARLYRNWKKAVQRTLDWVDEDVN